MLAIPYGRHCATVGGFVLLAIGLCYPLALDPAGQIPGTGPGDNVAFLWNFWWFRLALDRGLPFFYTPYLFAPFGTSLVLHTHTALQSLVGATLLHSFPVVAAHNIVLIGGLAANGIATYALAYYHVRRFLPSVLAGVVFASSTYVAIHLLGHFNLVHAWVLPLAALAWISCVTRPTIRAGAAAALAFGAAAYTDYYYLTYSVLFALLWWVLRGRRVEVRRAPVQFRRIEQVLLTLIIVAAAVLIAIVLSGGFVMEIGPLRLSALRVRNPLAALWLLGLLWLSLRVRVAVSSDGSAAAARVQRRFPALAVALSLLLLILLPLVIPTVKLLVSGNYVAPQTGWHSAPRGIDLVTLVLGNPLHPLYGERVRAAYSQLGVGMMEQVGWIGIVPMALLALGIRTRTAGAARGAQQWLWIGAFFLLWSAGPSVVVAGVDTGLPLPQTLTRYVPLLSNARMPGRGIVVVQLAAAVLCAMIVARRDWRTGSMCVVTAIALLDGAAMPFPMYEIPRSTGVESFVVGETRGGSVLELPAGLRDGFGQLGLVDHRALVYQTIHQRPLVGGFVARLSPDVRERYAAVPTLMKLFELSAQRADGAGPIRANLPGNLEDELRSYGIGYVVVNTDALTERLRAPLQDRGLRFVLMDGSRELYLVDER